MPIYEYECPKHGVFERIEPINSPEIVSCEEWSSYHNPSCGLIAVRIWSKCSMQPDNMWAGAKTDLGYFTSKKDYKDHIKNNNLERATRDNFESVQKNKAKRFETIAKKNKENLTKFIEKEIVHTIDLPNGD